MERKCLNWTTGLLFSQLFSGKTFAKKGPSYAIMGQRRRYTLPHQPNI